MGQARPALLIGSFLVPFHTSFEWTFHSDLDEAGDHRPCKIPIDPAVCRRIEDHTHAMCYEPLPGESQGAIEELSLRFRVGWDWRHEPPYLIGLQYLDRQSKSFELRLQCRDDRTLARSRKTGDPDRETF